MDCPTSTDDSKHIKKPPTASIHNMPRVIGESLTLTPPSLPVSDGPTCQQ